jgi:LysM repeat protein
MARKKSVKATEETKTENKDNVYVVVRGDTPIKIARKLSIDKDWLMEKNNLTTDRLEIGQELIVKD